MYSLCHQEKHYNCKTLTDIEGEKKILGTTSLILIFSQVSSSSERVVFTAIFNDVVLAGRGGSIHRGSSGSGSWTSTITSLNTYTELRT